MFDWLISYLDLYLVGVFWIAGGVVSGVYAMGVWQQFQEQELGGVVSDLGHKWFFMSLACPPAAMLTTRMFFPDVAFRMPRWR